MREIFWIGPIIEGTEEKDFPFGSPAASRWQKKVVNLISDSFFFSIFSFPNEAMFPRGRFWVEKQRKNPFSDIRFTSVSYINLFIVRDIWYAFALFFSLIKWKCNKNAIVVSYNAVASIRWAVWLAKRVGKKMVWLNINADRAPEGRADAFIFLSYFNFLNHENTTNRFHLDGIVELQSTRPHRLNKPRQILYFGSYTQYTGIDHFIHCFNEINSENLELVLCGRIPPTTLNLISGNPRIKQLGFLSEAELNQVCNEVDAFINPRPEGVEGGETNFPSKILEFLPFGKMIISTITPGLAPYYKEVLYFYQSNELDTLKNALVMLSTMSEAEAEVIKTKTDSFLREYKNNELVKKQLVDWINGFVN